MQITVGTNGQPPINNTNNTQSTVKSDKRVTKNKKQQPDTGLLNASTGEIKATSYKRLCLSAKAVKTNPLTIDSSISVASTTTLFEKDATKKNAENLTSVELAEQLELTRSKIFKQLMNLTPGLNAMATGYLSSIDKGVSPSEFFSINRSKTNYDEVDENSLDDSLEQSAKEIETQIAQAFSIIQEQALVFNASGNINKQAEFISSIHFLPIFLLQVTTRILNESLDTNKNAFNPLFVKKLAAEIKQMNNLRKLMVTSNLGLVKFMSRQYRTLNMTPEDLQQEGVIGLVKAVDRFDHRRKFRFSTYATYWVRQTITRSMSKNEKLIRIPINLAPKAPAVFQMLDTRMSETSRLPGVTELAVLCSLSEVEVSTILEFYRPTISLDGDNKDDNEAATIVDVLEQNQFPSAIKSLSDSTLKDRLHVAINSLSEKEAKVIRCRYGLENHTEMTLQDIANTLDVTRERVRQIQNSGLKKLQRKFGGQLVAFLEPD